MSPTLRAAYRHLIERARSSMRVAEWEQALIDLQRAHVLGQRFVVPHVQVHGLMFTLEVRRGRYNAALGQIVRIVLGALGSAMGRVPVGNTGDSDISMFKTLPIDPELRELLKE